MKRFNTRHIQVKTNEAALQVLDQLRSGISFDELARTTSQCPSAPHGGMLRGIGLGHLEPELDEVLKTGGVGKLYGPIATKFGFHVIEVVSRTE